MVNPDFARTLSLLRQEKDIPTTGGQGVGISQALLSHYENGIREPGLVFVGKACDFYHTSADFLLGRTLSRDGTTILDADTLYDASDERDSVLRGSVMATLSKSWWSTRWGCCLTCWAAWAASRSSGLQPTIWPRQCISCFATCIWQVQTAAQTFFSVPKEQFLAGLPRADMIMTEAEYLGTLSGPDQKANIPPMDHDAMKEAYPGTYQSLLQIVYSCGERLNREMALHLEHSH